MLPHKKTPYTSLSPLFFCGYALPRERGFFETEASTPRGIFTRWGSRRLDTSSRRGEP